MKNTSWILAVALRISGFTTWKKRANISKKKKKTQIDLDLVVWSCLLCSVLMFWKAQKSVLLHLISSCEYLQIWYIHVGLFIAELLRKEVTEGVNKVRSCVFEVTVSTVELSHCCMFVVQMLKTGIHEDCHWLQDLQEAAMKLPSHAITTSTLYPYLYLHYNFILSLLKKLNLVKTNDKLNKQLNKKTTKKCSLLCPFQTASMQSTDPCQGQCLILQYWGKYTKTGICSKT